MKLRGILLLLSIFSLRCLSEKLIAITVATEKNDALIRYIESAEINDVDYEIFGLGEEWKGGNMESGLGGGQKVNILKRELQKYKDDEDTILLFTDSYDVVINDKGSSILNKYRQLNHKVVFGAEDFCWPKKDFAEKYPMVSKNSKRFLNSGGFIGRADLIYKILTVKQIEDTYDDQLYYTEIFLDENFRQENDIVLDTETVLFQNLNGALNEVTVRYQDGRGTLFNVRTQNSPGIIHGNGPIKTEFNTLANYLTHNWNPQEGCLICQRNLLELDENSLQIDVAISIDRPVPFIKEYFEKIEKLSYPKKLINLSIYSPTEVHEKVVSDFLEAHKDSYNSVELIKDDFSKDPLIKFKKVFDKCSQAESCSYVLLLNGISHITNVDLIQNLMIYNRTLVGPKLTRRGKLWSNFWGALANDGYYARSDDYIEIVENTKRGLWNVPYISGSMLIKKEALPAISKEINNSIHETVKTLPFDMEFCKILRKMNIFMHVENVKSHGYLVNDEGVTTEHLNNDLWQIFDNPQDWEEKYISHEYHNYAQEQFRMEDFPQPCPDVFWFPLLSEKFCDEIVAEMEFHGGWSDGSNKDSRLEGGYENVPTRDIHMRQIEWEPHWLHVLKKYVKPIQVKVFQGHNDEPWARMNFIVRYRPDEQPSLRPHHDASSFTLNIALNNAGIDYQGGGARFIRYDCAVKDTRKGWALIHPGRVTHLHEGLPTTNGTRYIFVIFVNP